MLKLLKSRKAQNTMEYALLIAIVIGVFSAMQLYIRRGMQGRVKAGVDNIPDTVFTNADTKVASVLGKADQYEPYYSDKGIYNMTTTSGQGTTAETITDAGGVSEVTGATFKRSGKQSILGPDQEPADTALVVKPQ